MRVFVAGAAGAIGRRLVPVLVARGHDVTGTVRSTAKLGEVRAMGAQAVMMDGLDARSVGEAVARAEPEVIVHEMTAIPAKPNFRNFDAMFAATSKLRTVGTDNLLAAAAATGVRRFVAQSFSGWTNEKTGGWVKTEEDQLDTEPLKTQREGLAAIRYLERAVMAAPLEGYVLRYGGFYGPGATDEMLAIVRKRMLPLIGDGNGVTSFVHIDDAAGGTVAAIETSTAPPGIYNITDDEPARAKDWVPALAAAVGAKRPFHIPAWLGRLAAGDLPVAMMTTARGSSNAKAKEVLGWQPIWPSWRDGFAKGLNAELPV
jgi:nucleoside-diphosphate-sugar epimerase